MLRTHTCGELNKKHAEKKVRLCGWVHRKRLHGKLTFINLRDRYGETQVVFNDNKEAEKLNREDVISIEGIVRQRPKEMANKEMKTGEMEVAAESLDVLNKSEALPLDIENISNVTEDTRLKYRYVDLRRPAMQNNIILRHKIVKTVRDFMDKEGFLEIETPVLSRSTPEGARDYLVPSRVHQGKFFALPQSPQQYKQLLMVAGFDKYFQIVRCFRDEDLRADRQPEFTQIDIEMSFIEQEDLFKVMENMMKDLFRKILDIDLKLPFPRMTYNEAMSRYGNDRPDTRFGMELIDVAGIMQRSEFNVFKEIIKAKGAVKCIKVEKADFSRKDVDKFEELVRVYKAKGLVWLKVEENKLEGSIAKFMSDDLKKELLVKTKAGKGDWLFFVADNMHKIVNDSLGNLRIEIAKELKLIDQNKYNFLWVVDFPLLEFDENEQRHVAVHHPFTAPKDEDIKFLDTDVSVVRAKAHDLVLNGTEVAGGSIRIHKRELQQKVFKILGIGKKEAEDKFSMLLNAFNYGAPPHGGIAFGLDRLVAICAKTDSIREVIAFPKNKTCSALMEMAPSEVDEKQLRELGIRADKK